MRRRIINKIKLKTIFITLLAVCGVSQSIANNVISNIETNAIIENSCILTNPLNLNFEYDNSNGYISEQSIGIRCTTGSVYKITLDYGLNGNNQERRLNNIQTGELLNYQIYTRVDNQIVGDGLNQTYAFEGIYTANERLLLDMSVRVAKSQYVASGTYSDTIVAYIQY